jgi:hypothetical protein
MNDVLYKYMKRALIEDRGGHPETEVRTPEILSRDDIFLL